MSRSADRAQAPARADGHGVNRLAVVQTASGVVAAAGLLLLGVPMAALASPGGGSAPVVDLSTPVVAFYAGTAELDGSTTLEPTTTGTRSRLDCTILFGKDSDVLRPGARERLRRLAEQLRGRGAGRVQVTGYTDDLGSAAHGLDLSERRARRVAAELSRVLPARQFPTTVRGLGEAHPAVPNTSEANRRKNRRVTVTLTRATTTTPPARPDNAQPASTPTLTAAAAPSVPSPSEPTPTKSVATTTSPSAAPPLRSATPAVVPPPAPPGPSTSPSAAGWAERPQERSGAEDHLA